MRTVALVGAGGMLEPLVVAGLAGEFERVVAVGPVGIEDARPGVEVVRLDLGDDREGLKAALGGVSAVVHLADDSEDPDQGLFAAVLDAATAVGARHVTLVSSAMVYGAWSNNPLPISEDAPVRPNPNTAFAVHKADAERTALQWRDAGPTRRVALLRPAPAASGTGTSFVGRAMLAAAPIRTANDDPPAQFVHLEDLASAVVLAARDGLDGAFNVAPDGWLSAPDLRDLLGARPKIRVPVPLPRRFDRYVAARVGGPIPTGLLPYNRYPWVVANDRLRAAGWRPRYGNDQVFVAADAGMPWDSMNARQRQHLSLGAGAVVLSGLVAFIVRAIVRWRR